MAQNPPLLCPKCGTPAQPNQRFCAECGTTLYTDANKPTAFASQSQLAQATERAPQSGAASPVTPLSTPPTPQSGNVPGQTPSSFGSSYSTVPTSGSQFYSEDTNANVIPPPPPPDSFVSMRQQSPTPAPGPYVVPDYARAPKRSRGLLIITIVLLLVLALGGVGIYALTHRGNQPGNTGTGNTPGTGTTPGSSITSTSGVSGTTPTSGGNGSGPVQETVNLMFTYASLDATITSVQYAQSFSDDPRGGVRVAFKETAGPKVGGFLYSDIARLILPDQSIDAPSNARYSISPTAGTSRTNWIDFPVSTQPADLSKLVLQIGTAQENQMQIPLQSGADLSKYRPKTANPNKPIHYGGLNWTLKTATQSLSAGSKQAATGMRYVILTFNVDNPTSGNVNIGFVGEYMRLKSGDITNSPAQGYGQDTTLPTTINAQQTGVSGTVIFQMPENATAFTLIFLVAHGGADPVSNVQVNTDFTIS